MAKTLIVVAGPTAVGKTKLAIQLANHYQTEIISADSRQFYREMSIGTAKPTADELLAAKHHFIDSKSIYDQYSVGDYEKEALALITDLFKSKDQVILAGGSGLFVNAVIDGFDELPTGSIELRTSFNKELQDKGLKHMQDLLKELDPVYYQQVDLNNPQRIIRALEVSIATGRAFSTYRTGQKKARSFNTLSIGLNLPREKLYENINLRVDEMMEAGLMNEVQGLISARHLNPLITVGYSELFDHIDGKVSLQEAVDLIKQNTRHFAKRQLTWFRRNEHMQWFEPSAIHEIIKYLDKNLS